MLTDIFKEDIMRVEEHLDILVDNIKDTLIKNESKRLLASGGKRLRPLFLLWAAKTGTITRECYRAAASLELLHTASLIHDDIIDDSPMRRGQDTTLKIYGRERATSMGTILSLLAIDQITSLGHAEISGKFVVTLEDLCMGEIKQLEERYNFHCTYEDYLEKISKKTASLFALPCLMGGYLSGACEETIKKLSSIGFNIGCSFQILDDIMDIVSKPEDTGKNSGQDIKNGIITLPYLILMEEDPSFNKRIKKLNSLSSEGEFDEVIATVKNSLAISKSYKISNSYLDKAFNALSALNSPEAEEGFRQIIELLYKR